MLPGLSRGHDWVAECPSMGAGMPRWRGVTATDLVTSQATAKMHPAPPDSKAITAGGLEAAGHWGQGSGVEMGATSHRAGSFLPRQSSLRATLALNASRAQSIRPSTMAHFAAYPRHDSATHSAAVGRATRDCRRRRSPAAVSSRTISRDDTGWAPSVTAAP